MQIEKHLFRVAERTLKDPQSKTFCTVLSIISFLFGLFLFGSFCFANSSFMIGKNFLSSCLTEASDLVPQLQQTPIWSFYFHDFHFLENDQQNNQIIYQNKHCIMYDGKYIDPKIATPIVEYSQTLSILALTPTIRQQLNIKNLTIIIKYPFLESKLIEPSTILINDLLEISLKKENKNDYVIIKSHGQSIAYSRQYLQRNFIEKLYSLVKSIIFYVLVSVSTSLYIYGTIISAPAVIILILRMTKYSNTENMTDVYKIFPWIGLHVLTRQISTNTSVNKSSYIVCSALIMYFFTLYFLYYTIIFKATDVIFENMSENGVQQVFCSFIAFVEFSCIVFMRTRPFINFYPKIHSLLILLFLVYQSFVQQGYKKTLLLAVASFSVSVFSWMVVQLEIPAQNRWDKNQCFTPTSDRPRCGLFPVFNMTWINNLPDEWTMLVPLYGRQDFTPQQLSLVDKRYELLDEALHRVENSANN